MERLELYVSKLMAVLEFYLSLHEADEIYNMLWSDKYSPNDIVNKLQKYKKSSEKTYGK